MNGQGKETNTVLTNLSSYMTVVSDKPYSERREHRLGLPALRATPDTRCLGRRGLRPLHRTTLNLTAGKDGSNYSSTMKDSFGGKHELHPVSQFKKCPSLHVSHFDVGLSSECHTNTTSSDSFKSYPEQAVTAHVDRARWMKQMAGNDMVGCTQYNSKIDFITTYSKNHHMLEQGPWQPEKFNGGWKTSVYNICNGHLQVKNKTRNFSSISGNKILSETRKESAQKNILC